MTTQSDGTRNDRAIPEDRRPHGGAVLHQLLAGVLRRLDEPATEALTRAVNAELSARDARAYASGWQDAVETFDARRPPGSTDQLTSQDKPPRPPHGISRDAALHIRNTEASSH